MLRDYVTSGFGRPRKARSQPTHTTSSACAIALAVTPLMTPEALHRTAFQGDDDAQLYRIGSRLVILASCPLAAGIAADTAVVLFNVTECSLTSDLAALASLCFLAGAWLVYPPCFAMLTTGPAENIVPYDNRQVAVLKSRDESAWLHLARPGTKLLRPLLKGVADGAARAREGRLTLAG